MTDELPGLVVGTAGHIDHGKTSLVRTLTGTDLDRLPEEQARGITIALGFTSLPLPDGRRAAFVDVPGHERLVRTMIAGATGIDAVLLCVSAVDGVMPQTREHLAILDLLGVRAGAVVLTMADLVDEELLELAGEDARDAVVGTFLEGADVIPFSAEDGRGRDEIVAAIAGFEAVGRPRGGPFRLPVDRAFSRPGFGTVVTGTSWSGVLDDGATVTLLPQGRTARVRGLQVHGEPVSRVGPGLRAAINLAGVETEEVPRGTVVAVGSVPGAAMIDVRYVHLASAPRLPDGAQVRVLHGTAERIGRLHLADDVDELLPGSTHYAQIRLEEPLPCRPGDPFVTRRISPLETIGGGRILDPWAPRMRKRTRLRTAAELARLERGDPVVWLERAGEAGLTEAEWRDRADGAQGPVRLGDRLFAPPVVARLQGVLLEALARFHGGNPLALGAHRRELRRGRLSHLPDRVFDALVDSLSETRQVRIDGPMLRIAGFEISLDADQEALRGRMLSTLEAAGLDGVSVKALHEAHPEPEVAALVRLLESEGLVTEVADLGWVLSSSLQELSGRVGGWFASHETLAPGDFKELTGLTRKAAIPLLQWLDREKITRREGDVRVRGRALG